MRKNSRKQKQQQQQSAVSRKDLRRPLDIGSISRMNDFVFKKMLGTAGQERVLEGFVNAVQEAKGQPLLGKLEILNDVELSANNINEKVGILDIKAKSRGDAEMINIEVQLRNTDDMIRRSAFYTSEVYTDLDSIEAGEQYAKLPRIITINLLNYVEPRIQGEKFISRFVLVDADIRDSELDLFNYNFIEVPKFRKMKDYDLNVALHRWLLFLDSGTAPELREEIVAMDMSIALAEEAVNRLVMSPEERELYRLRQKYERDRKSSEAYIREQEQAKAEVKIQAEKERTKAERERAEKAEQEKLNLIQAMLRSGIDVEFISMNSGFSQEAILKMKKELKK